MHKTDTVYDFVIIGGGIVGVSTAWQLKKQYPDKDILLVEKESKFSCHQTGHNSGVIHAGVYYQPGSLKAEFCKAGNRETIAFCQQHSLAYEQCGKLLVATDEAEKSRMQALFERCAENEITATLLNSSELQDLEPHISGVGAILVKDTAIVDYKQITAALAAEFVAQGGTTMLQHEVCGLRESSHFVEIDLSNNDGRKHTVKTKFLVACTGLMADRIARLHGIKINFRIIPYRGEYYQLQARHNSVVQHLIYPIPDPELPFLGIHLTKMIDGSVTVGPNAVQGWKREGYGRFNFSLRDTLEMFSFPGFWWASKKHLKAGLLETKNSIFKQGYLKQVQKYCPEIQLDDLQPYPAGIRAQAVLKDGTLVHDFLFAESPRSLHVCNAPSPAATSALPIGRYICQKINKKQAKL